jgi:hypothetical protein
MESPPPSSASRPAGYAAIALASAAGVIAASRMSRPGLMLAASLALAWWKKHQHSRSTVTETPPPRPSIPVPPPVSPPEVPEQPPAPETALAATAPPANFWQPVEPELKEVTLDKESVAIVPEPALEMPESVLEPRDTFELPPPDAAAVEPPPPPSSLWAPEVPVASPPPAAVIQPETPPALVDPAPPLSFPVAPLRPEAPLADAWNDLRAALTPALGKGSKSSGPLPPVPAMDEPATASPLPRIEAPEMPEMYVFPPSSPLLDTLGEDEPLPVYPDATGEAPTVPLTQLNVPAMPEMSFFPPTSPLVISADDEEVLPNHPSPPAPDSLHYFPQPSSEPVGEIPDEVHLPGMTDEETAAAMAESGFLITDPPVAAEPIMPQFVHAFGPPAIVSKAPPAPEADTPANEAGKPLTAPVVIPREVQAKKSFFDWLRS